MLMLIDKLRTRLITTSRLCKLSIMEQPIIEWASLRKYTYLQNCNETYFNSSDV